MAAMAKQTIQAGCLPLHPDRNPMPLLCPAVEHDFMGIFLGSKEMTSVKPDESPPPCSTTQKNSEPISLSLISVDLCAAQLKLGPPSSGDGDAGKADARGREFISVNVGWPPISSYRKFTTGSLSTKSSCQHEGIVERPAFMYPQALVIAESDEDVKDECNASLHDFIIDENCTVMARRCPPTKLKLIKVSMDGTPIMRKLNLQKMQGYPHLSLELHKLFKFYKRNISCDVGFYSSFKGSKTEDFILTYKGKGGYWMSIGNTPWDTFSHTATRLRIMKKGNHII